MSPPPLLDRRLCFVLGKGGVGKSAVSAALALVAARAGKRTLLLEVAGQRRASGLFAEAGVGNVHPVELGPGLFGLTVDVERAIEEYLVGQLRVRPLVELLVHSRAFHHFAAAAPGLDELVTVGKIWTLAIALDPHTGAPEWDYLVVDSPATGHGVAMLETARRVSELAAGGPIRDQAERIQRVVAHPAATGIAIVARPEELAVTEAGEAADALRRSGLPVALAVLNRVTPQRFADAEVPLMAEAAQLANGPLRHALETAVAHRERERLDAGHHARLAAGTRLPVVEAPAVTTAASEREVVEGIAAALSASREPALGGPGAPC